MSFTNEHILVVFLTLYILYELYYTDDVLDENENIIEKIPEYNIDKIKNDECSLPDKKTAQCVADMLIKTKCVRCSLEHCDHDKTISDSCYKNEQHSCEEKTCSTQPNMF